MSSCRIIGALVVCWSIVCGTCATANAADKPVNEPQAGITSGKETSFERIEIDSLDTAGFLNPQPVKITAFLLKANSTGKSPGAVLAPACQGLIGDDGKIRVKYRKMAKRLQDQGITTLLVDGFNPRGFKEICTQSGKSRSIDTVVRLKDAIGGLLYMRSRNDLISDQVFLMSWGATGSFQAMNMGSAYYDKVGKGFTAAVMYYPECINVDYRFAPYAPIQMFVGEKDTWNPASQCFDLAKRQEPGTAAFNIKTYPDTYHAFDDPMPPRQRTDAAVGPVMVGGNPESAEDAYKVTAAFLAKFIEKK